MSNLPPGLQSEFLGSQASLSLLKKLNANLGNVVWQWISDSSAGIDQAACWGPLLIAAIAARYPAYTVIRYDWTLQWASGATYAAGAVVYNAGNIYTCTFGGTAGATAPTGTGTGISDGGCTWNYTSAASTGQYRAAVTLQTGTGANTLYVYLGSCPGFTFQYCLTNWTALVPSTPDLWTLNHGYNQSESPVWTPAGGGYEGGWYALVLAVIRKCQSIAPNAGVIACAQPPKASPQSGAYITAQALRSQAMAVIAATEGCGLIDAYTAFAQTPGGGASLVSSDGIHPSTAGYQVWLQVALAQFPALAIGRVAAPNRPRDRIVLPPSVWGTMQGTVTDSYAMQDQYNNRFGHLKTLPAAAQTMIGTLIDIPIHWQFLDITLLWSAATDTTTSHSLIVSLQSYLLNVAATTQVPVGGTKLMAGWQATTLNTGGNNYFAVPAARAVTASKLVTGYALSGLLAGAADVLQLTITRQSNDTMTGALEIHGVILDRVL